MKHSIEIQSLIEYIIRDMHIENIGNLAIIGEGHDGIVYKINDDYCIKIRSKKTSTVLPTVFYEDCTNICLPIKIYSSSQGHYSAFVQRYLNGESLQAIIRNRVTLSEKETLLIIYDILQGLNKLHSSGFVHRDFHPGNVMFDHINENKRAVIIDFDDALPYCERIEPCFRYNGYHAPEVVLYNEAFDNKSEVFTVGVIMWELLFGRCRFGGYDFFGKIIERSFENYQSNSSFYIKQVKKAIKSLPEELRSMSALSIECSALLSSMLNPDRNNRINAMAALQSQAFDQIHC